MNSARLSTLRGPHGEIVVTKTYSNFLYSVTMRTDGAINVRHGDWLSKYSSAMYNDFTHIHEFARMDKGGKLKKIHRVDHIFAGETIYHIPTYNQANPMKLDAIEIVASPLSDEQEEKLMAETLADDYDLQGERLEWLEHAAHIAKALEVGHDVAETVGETAGWIVEETAVAAGFEAAGTVIGLVSMVLEPIEIGIAILDALETEAKIAGMQAICYAITAWAFDDPMPSYPASLRPNWRGAGTGMAGLQRAEEGWKDACEATVRNLEAKVKKSGRGKFSYQILWQSIGGGERRQLARRLMDARAKEISSSVERISFEALNPDGYPN
jgi:hypothetical protein